jgi:hypothetical protein
MKLQFVFFLVFELKIYGLREMWLGPLTNESESTPIN